MGYLATDTATDTVEVVARKTRPASGQIARPSRFLITMALSGRGTRHEIPRRLSKRCQSTQARILGDLNEERAPDILEWMSPDQAADVLSDLRKKSRKLLSLMG